MITSPNSVRACLFTLFCRLLNLLKQYGGFDEYMEMNTEKQNQQQLKSFDLSEYRQVIHSTIIANYDVLIHQMQESLKSYVVPSILDHDEMGRGKRKSRKSMGHETEPETKTLVHQLEFVYNKLRDFGLDCIFIEQLFKQIFSYVCAVAMNTLMLRQEMCMWDTGMKIRYNISVIEDWNRSMKMVSSPTQIISGQTIKSRNFPCGGYRALRRPHRCYH